MTSPDHTRAVLLVAMGGPRDLAEVHGYLRRLFSDPYVLRGSSLKRWVLSRIISRAAAPKSRARYAMIGGGSTAVDDAEQLGTQLAKYFASCETEIRYAVGTRYSKPSIGDGLAVLARAGARRVTPVYLFPHETSAMTGSCVNTLERAADGLSLAVDHGVRHLGVTDAYRRGWVDAIRAAVRDPANAFVILACHSLPCSIIQSGDPYVREIEQSIAPIQSDLGELASGLAYQSQEGKRWLGPALEQVAKDARSRGFDEMVVAPLSFVGENTETLIDLDRDLREAAVSMGFRRYERLPAPNVLGFLCPMVVEALEAQWSRTDQRP